MSNLMKRLWNDDGGAIVSVELILVLGVLILGMIPGYVALRNSIDAALGNIANTVSRFVPSFTFSGFAITNSPTGNTIAAVGGIRVNVSSRQLAATQLAPQSNTVFLIPPAP